MRQLTPVVALALLLAGCGVSEDEGPRALDPAAAPFNFYRSQEPEPPRGDGLVPLYFVRDGQVVFTTRAVERRPSIDELLALLLEGPTQEQIAEGTGTRLPGSFTVEDVEVGPSGTAVVTLGETATQNTTPPLGYAQIVTTLTAPGRARAVRFRADGVDLQVPRGDGLLSFGPFTRKDYEELLALPPPAPPAPPATPTGSG
ncbi:MAG: GerMN domain-containing protein [Mycobacteriales bacterium]